MNQEAQEQAVNAYTKFLKSKQVDEAAIEMRVKYVNKLIVLVDGAPSRESYSKAQQSLLKIEEDIDRQQQLNFSREFYPFLMQDVKAIARTSETYGMDLQSIQFKSLPPTLSWSEIDALNQESLSPQENILIRDYSLDLQKQHLVEADVQAKIKLAKLMLLRLRDIPIKNNIAYRMAVDVTLPLFSLEEIKQRFLEAIREFFYIWIAKIDLNYAR